MSDRERVEALAKHFHSGRADIECSHTTTIRPCVDEANAVLDSPAMRDLLAEAKADALRDLRSAIQRIAEEWECEPLSNRLDDMVHARTCPNCHRADYLRALLAANPYRETEQADG